MQIPRKIEEKPEIKEEMLKLKTRKKIKVLNGACMETKVKHNFLALPGRVRYRTANVLRDVGYSGIIVWWMKPI